MSFRRQSFFARYKAPIIVCTGALLTGLISFFVTVKVYDNSLENNLEIKVPNKVVTNLSEEKDSIIVKLDEEKLKVEEKPNNEVISEGGENTVEEYIEEIDVPEISMEEYTEIVTALDQNDEVLENEVVEKRK